MSNKQVKLLLSQEWLSIENIDLILNFLELSINVDETKKIIMNIYITEDILECDCFINSCECLDKAWFTTENFIQRFKDLKI